MRDSRDILSSESGTLYTREQPASTRRGDVCELAPCDDPAVLIWDMWSNRVADLRHISTLDPSEMSLLTIDISRVTVSRRPKGMLGWPLAPFKERSEATPA